jgi:predicted PurR-regulated permease PerM
MIQYSRHQSRGLSSAIVVVVLLLVVGGFSVTMYWIASSMNERTRQLEERVRIGQETVSTRIDQLLNMTKELSETIESVRENQTALLHQLSLVMQELQLLGISLNQYAKYESVEITSAVC